jgi:hypothetical protein
MMGKLPGLKGLSYSTGPSARKTLSV